MSFSSWDSVALKINVWIILVEKKETGLVEVLILANRDAMVIIALPEALQ